MGMAALAILLRMWPDLEEEEALEFVLERGRGEAMPESADVTDELLERRHRKCLGGSVGSLAGPLLTGPAISGAGNCLCSPRLTLMEILNMATRNPSSVKSGSWASASASAMTTLPWEPWDKTDQSWAQSTGSTAL